MSSVESNETSTAEAPVDAAAEIPPELAAQGFVDVSPSKDCGILKLVRQAGYDTDCPVVDDNISVHYVATLADGGVQYDSSRERGKPFMFRLGKEEVIKGWEIGVATMARGEIAVLRCAPEYAYSETGLPPEVPPNAILMFEVEMLDFKGFDVSDDNSGTVFKSRVVQGAEFGSPNEASFCEIHITGKYQGRVFEDRDVGFTLGEGSEVGLVEGVELGLRRFTRSEKARLRVTSRLAYGHEGCPEYDIPPDADLDYEVELQDFVKGKEFWDLDSAEKIRYSQIAKDKGGQYFKSGKFKVAKFQYSRVVEYLQFSDTLEGEYSVERGRLLLAAHLNLALCHLKLGNDAAAHDSANRALELDGKSEKALFRRGLANYGLKDYDCAMADFSAVLQIDPENKAARQQLVVASNRVREQRLKERKTYAGMFDRLAKMDVHKAETTTAADQSDASSDAAAVSDQRPAAETVSQ